MLILESSSCGICFHNSTSGVDLPMKVVDFISSATPVLAYEYEW